MQRQVTDQPRLARQDTVVPDEWTGPALRNQAGDLVLALRGPPGTRYTIGRKDEKNLRVSDEHTRVSGDHATMSCRAGQGWVFQDSGSSMGSTINGRLAMPGMEVTLYDGDVIALGQGNDNTTYSACSYTVSNLGRSRPEPVAPVGMDTAAKKYGDRIVACLRNNLAVAERSLDEEDVEGVWKAAGNVMSSVKRLGETYAHDTSKRVRDINQAAEHRHRQKQRHDNHDPAVGKAVARQRRDNKHRSGVRGTKNRGKGGGGGTRVIITGISKGRPGGAGR